MDKIEVSQRAREATAEYLLLADEECDEVEHDLMQQGELDDHGLVQAFTRIEAEALARGRLEGAKAMQEAVILKLDECCEPCFQCNQNVTALAPAAIVKGLNDAD